MEAINLQNQGVALKRQGKFDEALKSYKESLELKIKYQGGPESIGAAIGYQVRVTQGKGPALDGAVTRETLGLYWEEVGDAEKAKSVRMEKPKEILCTWHECKGPMMGLESAKKCSACATVFYCGAPCQKLDWKRHKHFCTKLRPVVPPISQA
ncbi:hypothetical protein T439DRAFT_354437 [Meredithblackwellia eburnea MCA 4105]